MLMHMQAHFRSKLYVSIPCRAQIYRAGPCAVRSGLSPLHTVSALVRNLSGREVQR